MAFNTNWSGLCRKASTFRSRLTAIGAGFGIVLALALTRMIEAGLLGVVSSDFRIVAGFAVVLAAAALAAGYIPARRAATINPIVALRTE